MRSMEQQLSRGDLEVHLTLQSAHELPEGLIKMRILILVSPRTYFIENFTVLVPEPGARRQWEGLR